MVSALNYMGDKYASKYIIKRMQKYPLEIHNKGRMQFCGDILMGQHREKNEKILSYSIEEWHTSMPYDILRNDSTYPTVCFSLYMWHRTDHCITVCVKWIFDYNFKVALPITQVCLNYICYGNNTDENKFIGVLHAIRSVPLEFLKEG